MEKFYDTKRWKLIKFRSIFVADRTRSKTLGGESSGNIVAVLKLRKHRLRDKACNELPT